MVFHVTTPCNLEGGYQLFEHNYRLHFQFIDRGSRFFRIPGKRLQEYTASPTQTAS